MPVKLSEESKMNKLSALIFGSMNDARSPKENAVKTIRGDLKILALAFALVLSLSACGDGGGSSQGGGTGDADKGDPPANSSASYSFEVGNINLMAEKFCLDSNGDFACGEGDQEIRSHAEISDFEIEAERIEDKSGEVHFVAEGVTDKNTGQSTEVPFSITVDLTADQKKYEIKAITPLTALVTASMLDSGASAASLFPLSESPSEDYRTIRNKVAGFLEIDERDFYEDPFKHFSDQNSPRLFWKSVTLLKVLEYLGESADPKERDWRAIYRMILEGKN